MSSAEAPRTSAWMFRAFTRYVRWYLSRNFERVALSRAVSPPRPGDRPMIVFANHPSWWDPMFFYLLAGQLYPTRHHCGPMDGSALRRYPVLGRLGVFGVDPGPRGARQFLRHGSAGLERPGGTLWITPQGAFADSRLRPPRLEAGLARLALRVPDVMLVPLAIDVGFWNESSPVALLRFGEPIERVEGEQAEELTRRCAAALDQAMRELEGEAIARDAAVFQPLLRGRRGVGGVYDAWRRCRAWVGLRPARLGHETEPDPRETGSATGQRAS